MINQLTTSATFATSGATLKANYQPQPGITAVVGDNGAGKTFLSIEAIRWLLFGKKALRGPASDYKDAEVTGVVTIRGARYEISRGKSEWIKDASGTVQAKGAEKVTEYVTQLLGYDLDVFDLCNAATQGNVQSLGKMRPAERKAIIDKVAKLTSAEAAEKDCRAEALGYKRQVEALSAALRAPGDEPVTPAGYMASESLRGALRDMRALRDKESALRGQLRAVEAPQRPSVASFSEEAILDLQRHEDDRRQNDAERHRLTSVTMRAMPYDPHSYTKDQLDTAERRLKIKARHAARGPKPQLTAAQSEHNWAAWALYDAYAPSDSVTCPKCHHTFRTDGEPPATPAWSKAALRADDAARVSHAQPEEALPDGLDLTQDEIDHARRAAVAKAEHDEAARALAALPQLADKSAELEMMRSAKAALDAFLAEQLRYERIAQANAEVERQLRELGPVPTEAMIDSQADGLRDAEVYETAYGAWAATRDAYEKTKADLAQAQHLQEEYTLGAKGIADARAVVKSMIAPKISQIATQLIRDMSMGKLTSLTVDDDMDVMVGNQRIETLSGAGKTVANLALRIAFGRALVGHVFPVFLADEIDGDMTPARREATLQALVALKEHVQQIILVTHRGADIADQVWNVEVTG